MTSNSTRLGGPRPSAGGGRILILLLLAVVVVVAGVWLMYSRKNSEQWLASRGLGELRRLAATPDSDLSIRLAYAARLGRANQPQAALNELQRAERTLEPRQSDPMAAQAYARLAYQYAYLDDLTNAALYSDRARQIAPRAWTVLLAQGAILVRQERPDAAVNFCRTAARLSPRSYETHYMLGLALNETQDAKGAETELRRATELAPDFAAAHAELGHACAYQLKYADAAEQFRKARSLDPASNDYLFALGEALGLMARTPAQYQEAAEAQRECVRASPSNPALLFTLGQLHLRFMKLDAAYDCLAQAATLRPKHAKTWYNLARVEELLGRTEEATADRAKFETQMALQERTVAMEKQVAAQPRDARARLRLARAFHAEGNLKGCYVQLRAGLSLDPGLADADAELSRLQAEFQRLLDQNGAMAAKVQENNPTGPPAPN